MVNTASLARIAALVGDPSRAVMLDILMDGRALTASELAARAGITPQTASGHLSQLTREGLLSMVRQGRHRYFRLSSPRIAEMLESILQVAALTEEPRPERPRTGPRDQAMRAGRTCYDHLAGRLGVAIADALLAAGGVRLDDDSGELTDSGMMLLDRAGLDMASVQETSRSRKRALCRPCLDWSERRPHLAGVVGAAICEHSFSAGWVRRIANSRAVTVTPKGQLALKQSFGISLS